MVKNLLHITEKLRAV